MTELTDVLADYLLGTAHVGFVVNDLDAAVLQARQVYGVRSGDIRYEPEGVAEPETRFAFFSVAGLQFEYIEPCSAHFRKLLLDQPSGGGGINHVAWSVQDIHGAIAALAVHGITPGYVTPDGVINIGAKKMVYLDPATTGGLVIELIEYADQNIDA